MRNTFNGALHSVAAARAHVNYLPVQIQPEGETERKPTEGREREFRNRYARHDAPSSYFEKTACCLMYPVYSTDTQLI